MKNKANEKLFNILSRYDEHKCIIQKLIKKINILNTEQINIHSASLETRIKTDMKKREYHMLCIIEEITKCNQEKERATQNIRYIEFIINLHTLSKKEKMILNDYFIHGLSYKEIAIKYAYNESYVYRLIERLMGKLNAYMLKKKLIIKDD